MRELIVKELEAGQRLDKFLHKYLKEAPNSFLYKMMRKKNIVLNGKKVNGNEILSVGDCVKLFLAEETIDKFRGGAAETISLDVYEKAYALLTGMKVVEEFEDVIFLNKPSGVLSQKAEGDSYSANEWLIGYLLKNGSITAKDLETFKPSVCNRLDRNTSGLLIGSKTLLGSQEMARLLKERSFHKYYRCKVKEKCELEGVYEAFLYKDELTNKVQIFNSVDEAPKQLQHLCKPIRTGLHPLCYESGITCMEIELFTGKTHQIRAQMEYLGYPLVGDMKYNGGAKSAGKTEGQSLHAYRLSFGEAVGKLTYLAHKDIICPLDK